MNTEELKKVASERIQEKAGKILDMADKDATNAGYPPVVPTVEIMKYLLHDYIDKAFNAGLERVFEDGAVFGFKKSGEGWNGEYMDSNDVTEEKIRKFIRGTIPKIPSSAVETVQRLLEEAKNDEGESIYLSSERNGAIQMAESILAILNEKK